MEVTAANDKEDAPEPGPAMSVWIGDGGKRARGNESEWDRRIVKVSVWGGKAVVIWRKTALVIDQQTGWVDVNALAC